MSINFLKRILNFKSHKNNDVQTEEENVRFNLGDISKGTVLKSTERAIVINDKVDISKSQANVSLVIKNDSAPSKKLELLKILFDKASAESAFNNFYSIDVETTGLDPKKDKIIEISAIHFLNGEPIETFTTLVNPQMNIPKEATQINKITDDMVKDAPNISKAISDFWEFIHQTEDEILLCAHNADFDIGFIKRATEISGFKKFRDKIYYIDTLKISRQFLKGKIRNYKLATILKYFDIKSENAHRAKSDAISCGKIYIRFSEKLLQIYNADYDVQFRLTGSSSNKIQENIENRKNGNELKYRYNARKEKYEVYFEWIERETLGFVPKSKEKYMEDKSKNWIIEITNIELNQNLKYVVEVGLKGINF